LDVSRPMPFGRDLPELFETDAEFLRLAALAQAEALNDDFAEAAAGAFGEQRVFAAQFHSAREAVLGMAIPRDPHVACGNTRNRAVCVEQHLGAGEPGV